MISNTMKYNASTGLTKTFYLFILITCTLVILVRLDQQTDLQLRMEVCNLPNKAIWSLFFEKSVEQSQVLMNQWNLITISNTSRTLYEFGLVNATTGNAEQISDWRKRDDVYLETGANVANQPLYYETLTESGITIYPRNLAPESWYSVKESFNASIDRVRLVMPATDLLGLLYWRKNDTFFSYYIGPKLAELRVKKDHQLDHQFNIIGSVEWTAPVDSGHQTPRSHLIIHNYNTDKLQHQAYHVEQGSDPRESYTMTVEPPNLESGYMDKLFICKPNLHYTVYTPIATVPPDGDLTMVYYGGAVLLLLVPAAITLFCLFCKPKATKPLSLSYPRSSTNPMLSTMLNYSKHEILRLTGRGTNISSASTWSSRSTGSMQLKSKHKSKTLSKSKQGAVLRRKSKQGLVVRTKPKHDALVSIQNTPSTVVRTKSKGDTVLTSKPKQDTVALIQNRQSAVVRRKSKEDTALTSKPKQDTDASILDTQSAVVRAKFKEDTNLSSKSKQDALATIRNTQSTVVRTKSKADTVLSAKPKQDTLASILDRQDTLLRIENKQSTVARTKSKEDAVVPFTSKDDTVLPSKLEQGLAVQTQSKPDTLVSIQNTQSTVVNEETPNKIQ